MVGYSETRDFEPGEIRKLFESLNWSSAAHAERVAAALRESDYVASARDGGDRDQWLVNGLQVAQEWGIQGLSWFQVDKEVNWRLEWGDIPESGPLLRQLTAPAWPWMEGLTAGKTKMPREMKQPTHTCPDRASSPENRGGSSE